MITRALEQALMLIYSGSRILSMSYILYYYLMSDSRRRVKEQCVGCAVRILTMAIGIKLTSISVLVRSPGKYRIPIKKLFVSCCSDKTNQPSSQYKILLLYLSGFGHDFDQPRVLKYKNSYPEPLA